MAGTIFLSIDGENDLRQVDFTNAKASEAKFYDALLNGAIFYSTDISGASMSRLGRLEFRPPAKPKPKQLNKTVAQRRLALQANVALRESIETAKPAVDSEVSRAIAHALDAVAADVDRRAAAIALENLLREELKELLDKLFYVELPRRLKESSMGPDGAGGCATDNPAQLGAEVGVPRMLEVLRCMVEKHANRQIKNLAGPVAEKVASTPTPPASRRLSEKIVPKADSVSVPGDLPSVVYHKALHALLNSLATCLDDPSAAVNRWLLQQGSKLLQTGSGSLGTLAKRADTFHKQLISKLSEDHAKAVGSLDNNGEPTDLAKQLNTSVRTAIAKRALAATSRYAWAGWKGMLHLVWKADSMTLTNHQKELEYLLEKLTQLENADVTEQLWQDFYESWVSVLKLRSQLESECAQQIMDAITADDTVLAGLGLAQLLRDASIKSGQVPIELMLALKQGPGKHAKRHSYEYRRKIDTEISRISRIRDMKKRGVAQIGILFGSAMIGISTFLARWAYEGLMVY